MLRDGDDIIDVNEDIEETLPDPDPLKSGGEIGQLAGAIVQAIQATQPPRTLTFDEYNRKVDAHRNKPELTRKYFQNGILLQREQLSEDAINFLNALQPGLYCNGTFHVLATQDGTKASALDIRYNNKTVDDRMQLKSLYPTFEHMLAAMLKESSAVVLA